MKHIVCVCVCVWGFTFVILARLIARLFARLFTVVGDISAEQDVHTELVRGLTWDGCVFVCVCVCVCVCVREGFLWNKKIIVRDDLCMDIKILSVILTHPLTDPATH